MIIKRRSIEAKMPLKDPVKYRHPPPTRLNKKKDYSSYDKKSLIEYQCEQKHNIQEETCGKECFLSVNM